jgi:ABC-2 type transport system permease protein
MPISRRCASTIRAVRLSAANAGPTSTNSATIRQLATGRSRAAVIVDHAVGFATTLGLICAGLGLALIAAMAAGGQPDPAGSLITALACGLCALAAYASGVLISQFVGSVRSGTALAVASLTGLYLLTNVAGELGPVGAVRFVSPFHYFKASRALVPGHGLDLPAAAALLAMMMTVTVLAVAVAAFQRPDYAAGLWARKPRTSPRDARVQRPALDVYWSAILLRERLGLLSWTAGGAFGLGLMAWLEPAVIDVWDRFDLTKAMIAGGVVATPIEQYLSFSAQIVVPVITGYVIA